jgi:hypothetical protein
VVRKPHTLQCRVVTWNSLIFSTTEKYTSFSLYSLCTNSIKHDFQQFLLLRGYSLPRKHVCSAVAYQWISFLGLLFRFSSPMSQYEKSTVNYSKYSKKCYPCFQTVSESKHRINERGIINVPASCNFAYREAGMSQLFKNVMHENVPYGAHPSSSSSYQGECTTGACFQRT